MDVRKSRRLPSAATTPGVKYRLLLRVYAAENLRNVSSHGTYCKVYVGNADMAASRKGRQSFKKFLMSSSLSASSSASTPSSSYSSSTSSAGSPDGGASPQENLSRSEHNVQNNSNSSGINTAGTRVREFKTQVQKYSRASPVWNEKFEIPSVDPMGDLVSIRVKSARLMSSPAVGACCVPLRDVPEDETVDHWVTLLDGKKDAGRIRVQMRLVRADAPPAVKKESSARSRSQASDPAADAQIRASARRTSSKRSNRSSNSSSLSRTRLSGSISPVAKQALQSAPTDPILIQETQPPRKFSSSSNHSNSSSASSSNKHISRSQSRTSSRTQSEREASVIAARYVTPAPQPQRPQSTVDDNSKTLMTATDLLLADLEHASETSSSSSSSSFVSRIKLDKMATPSTKKTMTTTSRHSQSHNDDDDDDEDADSGDVVEASSLYSSMQHIRDRGTMLSEIGASSSSSLMSLSRSNGSFVGSLHLYNRNSIATSTPSRTTMVMSEAEIAALHSEYSTSGAGGSANGGRRRNPNGGGGDDRNSGQTEDTDSDDEDDEYDEPETEGPRIPWNSTITRLLARKSTNVLIDEDEEEDSDDDDTHLQRHGGSGNLHIGILHDGLGRPEEVPILDFDEPYDIDDIDCA